MLLLPGLLCDAALWAQCIERMREPVEVRSIDLSSHASIGAMAEAVLRDAPDRFSLAGFSMGGQVAMEVWARAPDRVERLALLSTNSSGIAPVVREHIGHAIQRVATEGLDGYLSDAFPLYFSPARQADAELRALFTGMAQRLGVAVAVRQMNALLSYPGLAVSLQAVRCLTTFICGACDMRTPPALHAAMAASIAGSSLKVIEGASHFTLLEAPQAVADALDEWLHSSTDTGFSR